MTTFPRFDSIDLGSTAPTTSDSGAERNENHQAEGWETPEHIVVPPLYDSGDLEGLDFLETFPGIPPFLRGPYATMYVNQ
ncbi:MAG TPA: methylmalonyl-CoA mutase family protein, partial [Propionibacteriaceae bacterium]|nr:methylmalonyl-CoA mutase family protein [Propionibacteriaceae bacterium]